MLNIIISFGILCYVKLDKCMYLVFFKNSNKTLTIVGDSYIISTKIHTKYFKNLEIYKN